MSTTNGLRRHQFHVHDRQMAALADLADENVTMAGHVRIAIDQYLERAARRQRRAMVGTKVAS